MTASNNYRTTWQSVAGPSLSGMDTLASLIKGAASSGKEMIGDVQKAREQGAAGAAAQLASQFTTADQLQSNLSNILGNVDPRYAGAVNTALQGQLRGFREAEEAATKAKIEEQRLGLLQSDLSFRQTTQQQAIAEKERLLEKERTAEKDKVVMFDYARLLKEGDPIQVAAFHNEHKDTFSRMGEAGAAKQNQATTLLNDTVFAQQAAPLITGSNPWENYQKVRNHLNTIKDPIAKAKEEKRFAELGFDISKPENISAWQKADEAIRATATPASTAPGVSPVDSVWGALIHQESGGRQFDKNGKPLESTIIRNGVKVPGAVGIAQVMEATGPEAAKMAGVPWDRERWLKDEAYNEKIGKAYLTNLYERYGDMPKALAAYNGGMGRVDAAISKAKASGNDSAWLDHMPEETRKYVPTILKRSEANAARVMSGAQPTPALNASKAEEMFAPDVNTVPTASINQGVPAAEQLFADAAPPSVRPSPSVAPTTGSTTAPVSFPIPEVKKDSSSTAVLTALEQAVRTGNRKAAIGLAESSDIGQIAVNSAKRSNTDLKGNVDHVRDRVGGDGKNFREDDLRNLYSEFTSSLPVDKKPTISQFTEMLTMSLKRGNAIDNLAFSGDVLSDVRSIIPGDMFTNKEYRFSPKTLRSYVTGFDAGHANRINELLSYASEQADSSKKVDATLEFLEKKVKELTIAAKADPDRFGTDLALARVELATALAKSQKLGLQTKAVQ